MVNPVDVIARQLQELSGLLYEQVTGINKYNNYTLETSALALNATPATMYKNAENLIKIILKAGINPNKNTIKKLL
jgi:hypothetical protein